MDKTFYCLLGALTATAAATVAVISTYDAPAPQQDGDSSADDLAAPHPRKQPD